MNKQIMRKHYEVTPKEILIDIIINSREEIERLNNIINKAYNETKKQNDEADYQEETDLSIILDILKRSDKE